MATAHIQIQNNRIQIQAPYALKDQVKALPGARWDPKLRIWHVPATPAAAKSICEFRDKFLPSIDPIPDEILALAKKACICEFIKQSKKLKPPPSTKIKPWKHQIQGYHLICEQPATMLAFDMGTGKSKCVVDAVCNLKDCNQILIVCPKSVIHIWPAEFEKHGGCPVNVIPLYEGSINKRTKIAEQQLKLAKLRKEKVVIVINYEAAWINAFGEFASSIEWDMIVADEIHRIKSPSGKASRFIARLKSPRKVGLTGTPLPHSPLDAYAQYRFLDPGIFGTSFVRFRSRYAIMGGYEKHQVTGYQNEQELQEKFYSIAHRVNLEDVIDLPPVIHEDRKVDLCPLARKTYTELEKQFISDVGEGIVTAANALARLLRLQQITSGFAKLETGQEMPIDKGKEDTLAEIFGDIESHDPIVVFCRFRHDLQSVQTTATRCNRKCYELSGSFNELAEWKAASHGEVLAVQIQAGGLGIDLSRAAYAVYFSLGFSLGDFKQSMARLHRPGQTRSVVYLHLIARNTVDEKVYKALEARADVVKSILTEIKDEQ